MKYEYLVIEISTINHVHKYPLNALQDMLNEYAEEGYRLVSCHHSSSAPGYVVVMERKRFV